MNRRAHVRLRWVIGLAALLLLVLVASVLVVRLVRPSVSVTRATEGPVVQAFYATGTIAPDREFPIKSHVAGIVVDVKVDKGQRVHKNEVLADVKNAQLPLKLAQAKAELAQKKHCADARTDPVLT